MTRPAAGLLLVLIVPPAAFGLATEQLGNTPIQFGLNFGPELLAAVNVEERVYWHEVNGNPFFFFKGDARALNQAVRRFAAIPAEKREIVLLPGPGRRTTFDGKTPVEYDWCLHVPGGLHFGGDSEVADDRATLTIHVPAARPPAPADPAAVKRWIAEVDSDDFKTRDAAAGRLEALGPSVAGLLRSAVKSAKSAEARDRLERVLARVGGVISLDGLDLPAGVPVVGLEGLLARPRKELANKAADVRGIAVSGLGHASADPAEIVQDLEKVLTTEQHEYPLRCAAGVAFRLGAAGKPLLPALRAAMKSDDKNVRASCQQAIDAIEKATDDPAAAAQARERAVIRKEIGDFVAARTRKK